MIAEESNCQHALVPFGMLRAETTKRTGLGVSSRWRIKLYIVHLDFVGFGFPIPTNVGSPLCSLRQPRWSPRPTCGPR